jgi:hypothetical protein
VYEGDSYAISYYSKKRKKPFVETNGFWKFQKNGINVSSLQQLSLLC